MVLPVKQGLLAIVVIASLSAVAVSMNHPEDEIVVTEGTPINVITAKGSHN